MITISPILPGMASHAGLSLESVLTPLRDRFWLDRGMPRNFRSTRDNPSSAGSMHTLSEKIAFPETLPYIAGTACGDDVRISGAELAPGALWYGDMTEAKLVLKDTSLPISILAGCRGRRIGEVVGHPALAGIEDEVIAVIENGGHVTFRTTTRMIRVDDPISHRKTPRTDWAREMRDMERAQGLHGRIAA